MLIQYFHLESEFLPILYIQICDFFARAILRETGKNEKSFTKKYNSLDGDFIFFLESKCKRKSSRIFDKTKEG